MFGLGDQGEPSSNKKTGVDANKTSDTFFPTVKAVFDWVSGLFVKGAVSSTDNAIARFDGTTGKILQNSGVLINDNGQLTVKTNQEKISCFENDVPETDAFFRITNATGAAATFIPTFSSKGNSNSWLYANGFVLDCQFDPVGGGAVTDFVARQSGTAVVNRPLFLFKNNTAPAMQINADLSVRFFGGIVDNVGSSGADGQVLKKVGGLALWSNP